MNYLFIIKSNNKTKGGSVFAPLIIRDVITEFYKTKISTLFFKETNFFCLLFTLNFSQPKYVKVNNQSFSIEIDSISQLLIWFLKNINKYNLVILHGVWSNIYIISSLLCLIFKKPFCFHPHGSLDTFDINKRKKFFKKLNGYLFYRNIFSHSSGLIFTSILESNRSKTYGANVNKYIAKLTSPNKTDNRKLDKHKVLKIKKKYKIKKEKKILLFLSRIDPKKGLDILLEALYLINKEEKSMVLIIAGIGNKNYINYIKKLIKKLNLGEDVRLLGHVSGNEKSDIMKISDLFVLPTLNENFGIAIVESLQNNLPVLITKDVYIYKEILKENACYICDRDPYNLSIKISNILIHRKDNKYEKKYINCFNNKFSREICAQEHFNIYKKLI